MTSAVAGKIRRTPQAVFALLAGALFGAGLAVSGMANPAKVLGFLDIAGAWDPTLAFVMLGALLVTGPAFRWILKRRAPWFGPRFALPSKTDLEPSLVIGSALFGIGWGIAGLCPGPAVTDLVAGRAGIGFFVAAMLFGAMLYDFVASRATRK
jgi:uncharacterized protein